MTKVRKTFPNGVAPMEQKMDLRIRKTYLALHSAFTQLLEERKFEDITVNELCDRAMIRRTTFYKHFADKFDYFSLIIDFYDSQVSGTNLIKNKIPTPSPRLRLFCFVY